MLYADKIKLIWIWKAQGEEEEKEVDYTEGAYCNEATSGKP